MSREKVTEKRRERERESLWDREKEREGDIQAGTEDTEKTRERKCV